MIYLFFEDLDGHPGVVEGSRVDTSEGAASKDGRAVADDGDVIVAAVVSAQQEVGYAVRGGLLTRGVPGVG